MLESTCSPILILNVYESWHRRWHESTSKKPIINEASLQLCKQPVTWSKTKNQKLIHDLELGSQLGFVVRHAAGGGSVHMS